MSTARAAAAASSPAAASAAGGGGAAAADSKILNTTWPDAMIHPGEEHFFSIVCGNTHYHWALHDGYREEFYPVLFWRTTTLEEDEWRNKEEADACLTLDRYLPHPAQEFIFGKEDSNAGSAGTAPAGAAAAADTNSDGAGGGGKKKKKSKRLQLIKHNKTTAATNAALRRVPAVTVYLVTTCPESESGLEYLFRDVPCNVYRFRAADFFSEDRRRRGRGRGPRDGVGIDRLAAVRAAVGFYGPPALVLDGGTCWTHTAADCSGNVAGGSGITNGLASKFGAFACDTGKLPTLTPDDVLDRVRKAADERKPIPFDARSTEDSMMSGVLRESALHVADVVKRWYRQSKPAVDKAVQEKKKLQQQRQKQPQRKGKAKKDGDAAASAAAAADNDNDDISGIVEDDDDDDDDGGDNAVVVNSKMRICITGGDSEIIGLLLKDNHSHVVECGDEGGFRAPDVEVKQHKHLIHHAVQMLLSEKARSVGSGGSSSGGDGGGGSSTAPQESDVEKHRKELLGQRVAKEFPDRPDERSKDPIYRGTLVTCDRDVDGADNVDNDLFRVQYDDGDGEDLNVKDVYKGLLLYHRTGEKQKESIPERREKQKTKLAEAKRAAEFLEVHSPQIRFQVEREKEKSTHRRKKHWTADQQKEKAAAAAASATSPSAAPPAAKKARTAEPAAVAGSAGAGAATTNAPAAPPAAPPVSGEKALKRRVAKYFDDVLYFGAVAKFLAAKDNDDNTDYYHVVYDDGDEEDMEHAELLDSLVLYEEKKEEDEQS